MSFNRYIQDDEEIMDYFRRTNEAIIRGPQLDLETFTKNPKPNTDEQDMQIDSEPDAEYDDLPDEPIDDDPIDSNANANGSGKSKAWAEGEEYRANNLAGLYEELAARLRSEPGVADSLEKTERMAFDFERELEAKARRKLNDGAEQKAKAELKNRRRFMTRTEHAELPPPQWLIEGLIPENADVAIYAPFAALKTFVAIDLAMSVAVGCKALGTFPVAEAGPVFYWVGEGHDSFIKRRMTAWETEHGLDPYSASDVWAMDGVPATTDNEIVENDIQQVEDILAERKAKLFVIDTMNRALNGQDEDKSHVASRYLQTVKGIRDRIGGTSITIAHMGKDPDRGERGSSGFPAGFDTIIWVEKCVKDEDGVHTLQLFVRKQKDAEDGQRYWFQSKRIDTPDGATSLVLIPVNDAEGKKALDGNKSSALNAEDVIAGLRKLVPNGGHVTTTELIKELVTLTGKAENTIRNALNKYNKQEGDKFFPFVHGKPGDGKWMLPLRYQLSEGLAEQMATWQRPSHEPTGGGHIFQ